MLNLEPYLERYPSELSGGQRQRVAIGRAIVREPELFLFDEPLSNLDAALRMNTRIEIAALHKQLGASMIYVTHDQTEAMTLADKIVVLRDGRVEQFGSPMELYNNPANQFVAGFLGSPSMNFFPAGLVSEGDDRTMGVRPEDLFIAEDGLLSARVSHVEKLGGDTNVIARLNDHQITARLFGQHSVEEGEELRLSFNPQSAYHFDQQGARLY
jgi:multiple sugar transport system ATP-binding protein